MRQRQITGTDPFGSYIREWVMRCGCRFLIGYGHKARWSLGCTLRTEGSGRFWIPRTPRRPLGPLVRIYVDRIPFKVNGEPVKPARSRSAEIEPEPVEFLSMGTFERFGSGAVEIAVTEVRIYRGEGKRAGMVRDYEDLEIGDVDNPLFVQ